MSITFIHSFDKRHLIQLNTCTTNLPHQPQLTFEKEYYCVAVPVAADPTVTPGSRSMSYCPGVLMPPVELPGCPETEQTFVENLLWEWCCLKTLYAPQPWPSDELLWLPYAPSEAGRMTWCGLPPCVAAPGSESDRTDSRCSISLEENTYWDNYFRPERCYTFLTTGYSGQQAN